MLIVLSVSAVSAAEADNTASNEIMMISDSSPDSTIQSNSNMNVSVQAEGDGTFTELSSQIEAASADSTLYLDKDYYWDGEGNYSGIVLDKTITIDGQGHTIDAESYDGGHVRIFNIYGTDIVLKNIVFANADRNYDRVSGGALYLFEGATTSLINCTFVNNTAGYGGAIYSFGGLNVTDCKFYDNSVNYNGACIVASVYTVGYTGAYLNVNNSQFYNNTGRFGGAILGSYESKISIANSKFINNSVTNNGGALDLMTCDYVTNISNCTFINNTAGHDGAVLYFPYETPVVVFDNCLIENNTANGRGGVVFGIYASDAENPQFDVTFNNCDIIGNKATTGGIAYIDSRLIGTNVTIIDSNVANNAADSAAIAYMNDGSKLSIINSNVVNNTADDGIAYYNNGTSYLAITNFTDLANAISNADDEVTLGQNVIMSDSEATTYANGILINKDITINGNGYTIDARELGRIFNITNRATVNLNNVVLANGRANNGAAIYISRATVNLNNVNIVNNTATGSIYAAIASIYSSTLNINNSTFTDNNRVIYQVGGNLNINSSKFINNTGSSSSSDVIFSGGATTTVNNSEFRGNTGIVLFNNNGGSVSVNNTVFSENSGQTVIFGNSDGTIEVRNSNFTDNSAPSNGGAAIMNNGANFEIYNSILANNTAMQGGAIMNNGGANLEIHDSIIANNSARGDGGAIHNNGANANIKIYNTLIANNSGNSGGVVRNSGTVEIYDSILVNNSARSMGGAIYAATGSEVLIENSTVANNTARSNGDAIYAANNNVLVNITDSTFINNDIYRGNVSVNVGNFTALDYIIGITSGSITLNGDVIIADEEATAYANGITIDRNIIIDGNGHTIDARNLARIFNIASGVTVTLQNVNLVNGQATQGGAILNNGELLVSNANFTDNTAASWGGAIYNNGDLTVTSSNFDSNDITNRGSSSVDYGGAAIFSNGDLVIDDSNFTNNIKNYVNGNYLTGAVTAYGDVTVSNSRFVNNSGRWGAAFSSADYSNQGLTTTITNSVFENNTGLYGAGVWTYATDFEIADSLFIGNSAAGKGNMTPNDNNGGAIAAYGPTATGTIDNSTFIDNNAQYGGAIYISENMGITIQNSKFTNNTAQYGGAIGASTGGRGSNNVTVINSEFTNNTADNGGAIYNNEKLNVTDSVFTNNTAETGSAILNYNDLTLSGDNTFVTVDDNAPITNYDDVFMTIEDFTDLDNALDLIDGVLNLNNDITISDDEISTYVNGITIDKDIIINGNGYTIDANNVARIFNIAEGVSVTLANVILINGQATQGGAILNNGELLVSNANFTDNTAASWGGAIYNNGDLTVTSSNFDSNDITNRGSSSVDYGGAAIFSNGDLVIDTSSFTNNIKNYVNGNRLTGAVTAYGDVTVSNSRFVNNFGRWGAAFSSADYDDEDFTTTITNSVFENNRGLYGVGVWSWGTDFEISDSTFINNSAFGAGDMSPNQNNGAAINVYGEGATGVIDNSTFIGNDADYGGAICISENDGITISNSYFVNNSAYNGGGAISVSTTLEGSNNVTVINSTFINNSAYMGGAIYNSEDLNVSNSNFINNTAPLGSAIFNQNTLEIDNSQFEVPAGTNEAIFNTRDLIMDINNFTDLANAIENVANILTLNGDVIITDEEASNFVNGITIDKTLTIDGNGYTIDARGLARVFNIVSGSVIIRNANIINGEAIQGGAIYNDGTLTLNNVNFTSNTAASWGGAVYSNGRLYVYDSNFDSNDITNREAVSSGVDDYGGAAIFSNGNLVIDGSSFTNNIKNYVNGDRLTGAVTAYGNVAVSDSRFVNNSGRWGAAFSSADYSNQELTTTITDSLFENNTGLYGAGVWSWGTDFEITDSTFINNSAAGKGDMYPNDNNGGAIAVYGGDSSGVIDNSTFIDNNAQYGGAIYISENMGITIQNSKFTNNTAQYGGAIGASTGGRGSNNVTVINSEFTSNTADNGGAIFNTEELNVTDSTFTNNAAENGSVIYTEGSIELNGNVYESEVDNAPIYAVGDVINTQAVITVLNNETVYVGWGEIFNLTATVTVDGAYVSSNTVYFLIDGETIAAQNLGNGSYVAQYTPNVLGTYTVYADINDMENTVNAGTLEVERLTPEITVEVNDTPVYDIAVIKGNISSQATGNVLIYVNGRFVGVAEISNGTFEFDYTVQNAVNYYVTVVYEGNSNISGASANDEFNGLKISFTPNIIFIMDGNNVFINITGIPTYGVIVSIVLDQGYIIQPIDGCYILSVEDLPYGNYSAGIYIWGDNYHTASYIYPVTINPIDVDISLSLNSTVLYVGDTVQIIADVVGLEEGNITFNLNDVLYTVAVNNGQAIIELDGLTAGSYSVIATYAGDYIHESAISNMVNFEIKQDSSSKLESSTIVDVENVSTVGNPVNIIATVSNGTGNVTFKVNGVVIGVVDLVNGHAMIEYVPATPGEFVVEAVYNGDFVYRSSSDNSTFTVERAPTDISIDINVSEDDANITVKLPEDATGNITVSIGNSTIEVPLVNGSANVTLKDLATGNNTITVTYNGDDYYAPVTESDIVEITVLKAVLTADDIVMIYRDGTRLEMVLTDIDGNPLANQIVYITINGVTYNRTTDSNGHASIAINLAPNEYVANIEFRDGVTYASTQTLASVTVISSIEGNDVVKYFRNGTQYYATFYGSDGKPLANTNVTFNINGVFYTRQTNENGTARLNINLNPGQYIVTAINPVNNQHYSNNITVLPTISAEDVLKYFRNGTQYDVTVLDAQGAPAVNQTVEFNINGVFYYRQTDENGTARLSINLNPGEYIVTASANGLSVSNNITVLPTMYGEDLVKDFNEAASYNVTVVDGQGNPVVNQTVTMNINGVFYNRNTDENGIARLNINLNPGVYIITSEYDEYRISNTITVN